MTAWNYSFGGPLSSQLITLTHAIETGDVLAQRLLIEDLASSLLRHQSPPSGLSPTEERLMRDLGDYFISCALWRQRDEHQFLQPTIAPISCSVVGEAQPKVSDCSSQDQVYRVVYTYNAEAKYPDIHIQFNGSQGKAIVVLIKILKDLLAVQKGAASRMSFITILHNQRLDKKDPKRYSYSKIEYILHDFEEALRNGQSYDRINLQVSSIQYELKELRKKSYTHEERWQQTLDKISEEISLIFLASIDNRAKEGRLNTLMALINQHRVVGDYILQVKDYLVKSSDMGTQSSQMIEGYLERVRSLPFQKWEKPTKYQMVFEELHDFIEAKVSSGGLPKESLGKRSLGEGNYRY